MQLPTQVRLGAFLGRARFWYPTIYFTHYAIREYKQFGYSGSLQRKTSNVATATETIKYEAERTDEAPVPLGLSLNTGSKSKARRQTRKFRLSSFWEKWHNGVHALVGIHEVLTTKSDYSVSGTNLVNAHAGPLIIL
jgi:hypothetical protein